MSIELKRLALSRELHASVRDFAGRSLRYGAADEIEREFEVLACRIAEYQTGRVATSLDDVVRRGVVTDCFRLANVFGFDPADAKLRFVTSGTTSAMSGVHYMREHATYEWVSALWGKPGLGVRDDEPPPIVVALAPWTGLATSSSLGYMMQRFIERFDGRSLTLERSADGFVLDAPERWLVSASGVNLAGLRRVRELAARTGCRVTLLATSFALVELLDSAGSETFGLPTGSVVMPTGGFKGRSRTVEPAVMQRELLRVFGDVDIIGEYGMTELTSQLYEATSRTSRAERRAGVYLAPPWLRVVPLEPTTLKPAAPGDVGLACFIDLGNVDSAVCVLTQDLVRVEGDTRLGGHRVQLLGRQPKAPLRGCSLAIEALLRRGGVSDEPQRRSKPVTGGVVPARSRSGVGAEQAIARVAELVTAAAALVAPAAAEPQGELVTSLSVSSGLCIEGVRLAIEQSLEVNATRADIAKLVQTCRLGYGATEGTAWVLLSSNVFTAPLRAIAMAAAVSSRVKVRPSRRDPRFAQVLCEAAPGAFEVVTELEPERGDVVFAYGSDETLEQVSASMPPGVRFFGHGHGMGVAAIGAGAATEPAAAALALDVVLFDQQGCSSPRLVLIDQTNDVDGFVAKLASELASWGERVPMGRASASHLHEAAWSERAANNLGRVVAAGPGWLGCYEAEWAHRHAVPLPPPCRSLSVVTCADVVADLAALGDVITTVGLAGQPALLEAVRRCLPGARVAELGAMQRPPFDGPVDRRGLKVTATAAD